MKRRQGKEVNWLGKEKALTPFSELLVGFGFWCWDSEGHFPRLCIKGFREKKRFIGKKKISQLSDFYFKKYIFS